MTTTPLSPTAADPTAGAPSAAAPTDAAATDAAPTAGGTRAGVCCRRPMTSIEVTARGATLVLHSCTACGRHAWERDGRYASREELLAGVKTFLEQPRQPTQRRRRNA